jgi:hypothetical protein
MDFLKIVSERIIPSGGPFTLGGGDVDIEGRLKEFLEGLRIPFFIFKLLLVLFDFFLPITILKLGRFKNLNRELQILCLRKLEQSGSFILKNIFLVLKSAVMIGFYSNPYVSECVGYKVECLQDGSDKGKS